MELKFYLNKFLKVDNIEHYTLDTLFNIKDTYEAFIEKTEGIDPDFPLMNFGDKKGKKISGQNIYTALGYNEDDPDPDFKGIETMDFSSRPRKDMGLEDIRKNNREQLNRSRGKQ